MHCSQERTIKDFFKSWETTGEGEDDLGIHDKISATHEPLVK